MTFEVRAFKSGVVSKALAEFSGADEITLKDRVHASYFAGYLSDIGAATLVAEHQYIDKDYLEDYEGYYARCFSSYERRCTRLHFFSFRFSDQDLANTLNAKEGAIPVEEFQKKGAYLGFIVVKPLPMTVIGRTCLAVYPSDGGRRHYPVTREYSVSLFGIELRVRSLAFQEQDRAAAA